MKKILIVEDFDTVRALVSRRCVSLGFEVDSADTLSGALSLVAEHIHEVVIVDYSLRNSDVLRTIKAIRSASPQSYIILMDYPDNKALIEKAFAAGVQKVFNKTNSPHELHDLLIEVVRKLEMV